MLAQLWKKGMGERQKGRERGPGRGSLDTGYPSYQLSSFLIYALNFYLYEHKLEKRVNLKGLEKA